MVRRLRKLLNKRPAASPGGANFRQRYDDVERERTAMLERLAKLDAKAQAHPAFRRF